MPDKMGFKHYVETGGVGQCVRRDIVEGDPSFRSEFKEIAASHSEKYVCWPVGDEIFVAVGDSPETDAVIRCKPLFESIEVGPRCTAEINADSWGVEYSFWGSELARWKDFDLGVRRLLRQLTPSQVAKP